MITETEDWKLGAFMDWTPKQHNEECNKCNGTGETGGGFKSIDGPQQCYTCGGTGSVLRGPTTPKPPIPPNLKEHMRRAWVDFIENAKANKYKQALENLRASAVEDPFSGKPSDQALKNAFSILDNDGDK